MTRGGRAKLDALAERLTRAAAGGLSEVGRNHFRDLVRWRLGVKQTKPMLRGVPSARLRYDRLMIAQRADRALAQDGVADEVEAAGGAIR